MLLKKTTKFIYNRRWFSVVSIVSVLVDAGVLKLKNILDEGCDVLGIFEENDVDEIDGA